MHEAAPERTRECTESNWQERLSEAEAGRALPYEPHRGEAVVAAFTRAGFVLELENQVGLMYDMGFAWQDVCKVRWFTETRFFEGKGGRDGFLKIWVLGASSMTPEWVAFRTDMAEKYKYRSSWAIFSNQNVVAEYFFRHPDGTPVEHDRREDVRRIVTRLEA